MRTLPSDLRKQLEVAVVAARRASESAVRAALDGLGVFAEKRPSHLDEERARLRNGLRAKWRQLGSDREVLVAECAYEQWHRLLFARFLAENNLLLHPVFKAPVTLEDCDDLAAELGEPDGWSVAARFAAEILPGIFRLEDPCVRLPLARDGRQPLEQVLKGMPSEVFAADDALGWVYQFWQRDKKDEVNASERKIGGADLGPVTQLFTENYMVRFLLENSLGAWWAARYPESPLVKGFDYLRFGDDGRPAAGSFEEWPDRVAGVTVMDPCCGSGHFLVEAFSMLWQMRAEEESLGAIAAQDAVLRDNLFGLEVDPRCVQIAMFAVALQAWKAGGGWRQLPIPNIACSGIPVKAPVDEWKALGDGNQRLENALVRLHILFRDADTLGSLIDPKRATEITDPTGLQKSFEDVDWEEIAPLLREALRSESEDPAVAVLGADAGSLVRCAQILSQPYSLVATNPPFLLSRKQSSSLTSHLDDQFPVAGGNLATAFLLHGLKMVHSGTVALVLPENWIYLGSYEALRKELLTDRSLNLVIRLGSNAFRADLHPGARFSNAIISAPAPAPHQVTTLINVGDYTTPELKDSGLRVEPVRRTLQQDHLPSPEARILAVPFGSHKLLSEYARAYKGLTTGDDPRRKRYHWELPAIGRWERLQTSFGKSLDFNGCHYYVDFVSMTRPLQPGVELRGEDTWGKEGIAVSQVGLAVSHSVGAKFDQNVAVILPKKASELSAVYTYCSSDEYKELIREIDESLKVTNATLVKVPFDIDHWRKVAEEAGPLPEPWSDDPTQWLFEGRPEASTAPLQVAVARLVGYRWPEQPESDDLDQFADPDGIVCLPSVAGEPPASDRVQQVLATAFGAAWSPTKLKQLLEQTGTKKSLADWLRDEFFKQHCALFGNRPFVWHVWDGQRDGFSALVNYHRLDRKMLEKLTYTYLGQDWVERQRVEAREDIAGAEARLAAALGLQRKLEAILEGEKPLDVYVRWKELHEQPIGWEPDLNDGVRLNIRPFVQAGVFRTTPNIKWTKDRGKNPDGSERHNDRHLSLAEKREARKKAGR